MDGREEFLEAFGINPDSESDNATDNVGDSGEAGSTGDNEGANGDQGNAGDATGSDTGAEEGTGANNEEGSNGQEPTHNTKAQNAFASMRVENRKQKELLNKIAGVLGVDTNNLSENDLFSQVESAVIKAQARQQGIPAEVLQRLNNLEVVNQKYNRDQAYLAAGRGIQQIKNDFGATKEDLDGFMEALAKEGINPFENPVNLVNEYKLRNFDKIIQAKVQAAVQAEQQRASKAEAHSTTPNDKKGGSNETTTKINNLADLDAWLAEHEQN